MSIIEQTTKLQLTQFKGSSIKPAILDFYSSDMVKIDNAFTDMENGIVQFETDVTDRVNALDTLVQSYDTRVSTLESCCADVNTTLLNYGSRLVEIERVIDTVSTANIDDLTERVNALENKVETNITNISILRNDLRELTQRVDVAENTLVEHGTQLADHENRISNIERCCDEVHGELSRIEGKVDNNKSEIDALKLRVTANEGNIAANAQDITILSGQVAVNTADIEDLKQGLAELDPTSQLEVVRQVSINTTNIANLQTSVNAQASNLTALTTRVSNAEDDIVDLKADNVVLHNEIAQVTGWETRISAVEQSVSDLGDDVDAVEATVAGYDATIASMQSDISTNAGNITSIDGRVTTLESKVATDESNFTALSARVAANEADLTNIHQTITNDEAGLSAIGTRVTALETQNGNTPLTTTAQTLSGGVNEVNTLVVNADSKATQALSEAAQASADASQASSDASQASSDAAQAVSDVAQVSSDVSDIQAVIPSDATSTNKLVSKDSISDMIIVRRFQNGSNLTFAAGQEIFSVSVPFTTPTGYSFLGVCNVTFQGTYSNSLNYMFTSESSSGNTANILEVGGHTCQNIRMNIDVMYIKNT